MSHLIELFRKIKKPPKYKITVGEGERPYQTLFFVTEPAEWAIYWDGQYITENLNKSNLMKAKIVTSAARIRHQIIHYGSVNTIAAIPHPSNRVVVTWAHVVLDHPRMEFFKAAQRNVDIFHCQSTGVKDQLTGIGIPEEKIVIIPLGVDLGLFEPVDKKKKIRIRRELGLPFDKIIIGSFQKDGKGWGTGEEPKMIKGPDVFCDVVRELSKRYPIHVLLTGPSRGYVKQRLDQSGIPYHHFYLKNYLEMSRYYQALDLYLITSRLEGGPKAVLESMASGIPVISTKVGIAFYMITDGYNGLLTEIEDVDGLAEKLSEVIENRALKNKLTENALITVRDYSWDKIAREYYRRIYSKLTV